MSTTPNKGLNIALWVAQGLLAAMFLMAGFMKSTASIETLSTSMPWVTDMPGLTRFIGISELLGGIGLILPSLLRIQPKLTVFAALGLVIVMVLASLFHLSRGEYSAIPTNLLFGVLAAFVAWGRTKKVPINPK